MGTVVVRIAFGLLLGWVGFVLGSLLGTLVGAGVEVLVGQPPADPSEPYLAYSWGLSYLGGIVGFVGAIVLFAIELGRRRD